MLGSTSKKKTSPAQLLFASISGEADANPPARQKDLSANRAQHVTLLPIGYHPVDETNVQLVIQAMTRVSSAPPPKMPVGITPVDDSGPRFGGQYSKDIGRYDQRIIVRESFGPEGFLADAPSITTTSRLPPVLTAEEKAFQAEQKRLEAEALAMAAVLEKNIYKKPEDTIQAMLGKLFARMWQDGMQYVNAKLGRRAAPAASAVSSGANTTKAANTGAAPGSPFKSRPAGASGPVNIPIH